MADKSLRTKALQVALRILGDEKALSRRLHVPMTDLSRWLRGEGQPTQTIYLRTLDFLIEHSSVNQLHHDELPNVGNRKSESKERDLKKL